MDTNILLVDDNEDLLKITQIILKSQGYTVYLAASVAEATEKISIFHPSLIMLDVNICNEDGRFFCNRLKKQKETSNIRVILMSGNEYPQEDWNGANDFLQKPFEYTELLQKVQAQLHSAEIAA